MRKEKISKSILERFSQGFGRRLPQVATLSGVVVFLTGCSRQQMGKIGVGVSLTSGFILAGLAVAGCELRHRKIEAQKLENEETDLSRD